MHRLVAEAFVANPDKLASVDHIDRMRINNNASNLRWCSAQDQARNRGKRLGTTSRYLGVSVARARKSKVFRSQLCLGGKNHVELGYHESEAGAALARDEYIKATGLTGFVLNELNLTR